MARQVTLKASSRLRTGRSQAKKTRLAGAIPGTLYGSHIKPLSIQVDEKELDHIFKNATSENMLVELALDEGGKVSNRLAFIQDIQHHPIKDNILHLDLHEVRADEKLHASVPILAVGEAEGVRTSGGILEQVLHQVEVECLPKDLPDRILVDVSALKIGENIHASQLKLPENVQLAVRAELSVFTVLAPVKEEVVAPTTAETAAEPEVIKQKKAEGEEEAAPEKGEAKGAAKGTEAKGGKTEAKGAAKPSAKEEKKK